VTRASSGLFVGGMFEQGFGMNPQDKGGGMAYLLAKYK
jgi:hypothetical protein